MRELLHTIDFRTMVARIGLGSLMAGLSLLLLMRPLPAKIRAMDRSAFDRVLVAGFLAMRLLFVLIIFGVLHQKVRGDLPSFYVPEARSVLQGLWPYRDFKSSYAPLHSAMGALLLRLWNSPFVFVLFAIVCDVLSVPFWIGFLRRFLKEDAVRRASLMVLVQPVLLWSTAIDGRNDALVTLLLAVSLFLVGRKDFLSGMSATASIVLVKFLPGIWLPSILAAARRRGPWVLGAALLPVIAYGYLMLHHFMVTQPLAIEASLSTAGAFSYTYTAITGHELANRLVDAMTALALGVVLLYLLRATLRSTSEQARLWVLNVSMVALLLTLLVVSKKSFPVYLVAVAFPLTGYVAASYTRVRDSLPVVYGLLLVLSMFVTSFWFWPLGMLPAPWLHQWAAKGSVFAMFSIALLTLPAICYLYVLVHMLRNAERPAATC